MAQTSFVTRMELNSRDETYVWLMEWLHEQTLARECRSVSVSSTWQSGEDGDSESVVLYTPDVGSYAMMYKGTKIWISRARDEGNTKDELARFGGVFETMTLTCWGKSRRILEELIEEARALHMHKDEGKTVIYTEAHGGWQKFGPPRLVRPLLSVVLPQGLSERLVRDATEFLKSSSWYAARGIPYRRGYLLYGPPGTGKTSFVTALAGHLGMSICVVNLNSQDLTDDQLVVLLNRTPGKKCILLIEDIDAAPSSHSRTGFNFSEESSPDALKSPQSPPLISHPNNSRSNVSLSGLLNALDGVASQEGRLLFMTTNHFELLDPALSRPGRIDVKVLFPHANKEQLARLFVNFYPDQYLLASQFADAIPTSLNVSSAHVQAHFMLYKFEPLAALNNIKELIDSVNHGGV